MRCRASRPLQHASRPLDEYAARVREAFGQLAANGTAMEIEFRFVERIASGEYASERGRYRLSVTPPGAETRLHFAEFHTIARKREGVWRIVMDHDHSHDGVRDQWV